MLRARKRSQPWFPAILRSYRAQGRLRRFRGRQKTPFKSFKITPDDWRNRKRWDDYEVAVCDMVERTSNRDAPWILVPANDKYSARIQVLKTLCERIEASL